MDIHADDLAAVIEALDLREAVLVGAVPPLMLKTAANPGGLPGSRGWPARPTSGGSAGRPWSAAGELPSH